MRITLCARSKILQLIEPDGVFRIQATGDLQAGSHIDLIPNSPVGVNDVTISHMPRVVVSLETAALLTNRTVDYDYEADEFIISNRANE